MTLDIDQNAISKKLRIVSDEPHDKTVPWLQHDVIKKLSKPSKRVEPFPGSCIKTWDEDGNKVFINICHSKEICAPEDISDDKFNEMITDEECPFVIPMAIGTEKMVKDKSDDERSAFDILINSSYFEKCLKKLHFWQFTIAAILQSLNEKCNKSLNISKYIILKNRKVMGSLDTFTIEDRGPKKPIIKRPLIQVLDSQEGNKTIFQQNTTQTNKNLEQNVKEEIKLKNKDKKNNQSLCDIDYENDEKSKNYIILKSKDQKNLIGLFYLPSISIIDITVDIGENRIIIEYQNKIMVDTHIPHCIDSNLVRAKYDNVLQILRLTLPIIEEYI